MSTETKTHTVSDPTESVQEPSWFSRKVVTPVRNHPKIAAAVVLGVALIAGAAVLGNSNDDDQTNELESGSDESEFETTVA